MLAAGRTAETTPRVPVDPRPCSSPIAWEKPASVVLLGAASSLTSGRLKMPSPRAGQTPQRGGGCLQPHACRAGWNKSLFRCIRSRKVPIPTWAQLQDGMGCSSSGLSLALKLKVMVSLTVHIPDDRE